MTSQKRKFLASTAYAVVGLGLTASQAMAFDSVNWDWQKLVDENVIKDVNVTIETAPSGMVEIEKIQAQIGDVKAKPKVHGIENNPPSEGDGFMTIDETFDFQTGYDDEADPDGIDPAGPLAGDQLSAELTGGEVDEGADTLSTSFRVFGDVFVEPEGALNALELPHVESIATAVGNSQEIESDVSLELHDGQYLFGDFNKKHGYECQGLNGECQDNYEGNLEKLSTVLELTPDTDNTHTDTAAALALSGALGLITQADVEAKSKAYDILNTSVDSAATAVGNNIDATLTAATADDAFMIADITQFGYADVEAKSKVYDVSVNNYTGFGGAGMGPTGDPQKPLVSSVATAVGNNVAIKVSSPGGL